MSSTPAVSSVRVIPGITTEKSRPRGCSSAYAPSVYWMTAAFDAL